MQEIDPTYEQDEASEPISPRGLRRLLYLALAALLLLLLVLLPPLISVNRFQRRIATSIGDSLGRPVHLDKVSLNLLPLPGFTLKTSSSTKTLPSAPSPSSAPTPSALPSASAPSGAAA